MRKKNISIDEESLVSANEENGQEQLNNQHNTQDLDQEQKVYANPFQFNSQNINVIINNNYSGKIMGVTFSKENKKILSDVNIDLFPGDSTFKSICTTKSDENGSFEIGDIPPGYYTLTAYLDKDYKYKSKYIKVMVGQSVYHSVPLKYIKKDSDLESRKQKFYSNIYY